MAERAGPRVARLVFQEIRRAVKLVGNDPSLGHVRDDLTDRPAKFWPVYSYLVVYDPNTEPVEILRVLHGMRDVEGVLN